MEEIVDGYVCVCVLSRTSVSFRVVGLFLEESSLHDPITTPFSRVGKCHPCRDLLCFWVFVLIYFFPTF